MKVNELFDYWGGSMLWRLTPTEVRRVLHLRSVYIDWSASSFSNYNIVGLSSELKM